MGLLSKWRLFRSKCSWCNTKIPESDLVNALSHHSWNSGQLFCKKCRGEGNYDGRCPICNNGKMKETEDRSYSRDELERMHKHCLNSLLNDYKYQYSVHYDTTIENLSQNCSRCGQYIYRENAECPFCKKQQKVYGRRK